VKDYQIKIGGGNWSRGPVLEVSTLRDAYKAALSFGNTADWAEVWQGPINTGTCRAEFRRSPDGRGMRWYRAA
jgi:hypothetical protein